MKASRGVFPIVRSLIWVFLLLAGTSCNFDSPSPIEFGRDSCHACKMMFTDKRFGGEIVLRKGKVYKFDSLECMLPFLDENKADIGKVYVLTAEAKGELIAADDAVFMIDPSLRSPMGEGVLAAKNSSVLQRILGPGSASSKVYRWADIVSYLKSSSRRRP